MSWFEDGLPSRYERRINSNQEEFYVDKNSLACGKLEVGRYTYIGEGAHIVAYCPIVIGSFTRIARKFHCVTHEQHAPYLASTFMFGDVFDLPWSRGCGTVGLSSTREVVEQVRVEIGHDVCIGNNVNVFGGVTIGNGCVIRPGSLVNKDCVAYGVYQGVPAKLVAMRFPWHVVAGLQELRWWDWPLDQIQANAAFFEIDLAAFKGNFDETLETLAIRRRNAA